MVGRSLKKYVILSFLLILMFSGCATIPPEAPELSSELGNRISNIKDANLTLLHRFFDLKRNEVDRFVQEEWAPVFAKQVFSDPKMKNAWNTIVKENNPAENMKFLIITGPRLQKTINQKRLELIKPLDDIEKRVEQSIRAQYSEAIAINNSLTSLLLSASKVVENRNRYLQKIGITDNKITEVIDGVNDVVADLLEKGKTVKDKITKTEEYIKKLRELRDSFKKNKEE